MSAALDAADLAMIDDVRRACADVPVINLAGRLTLKELGALIDACRCLVCVDSLPMHMASALKRPCVALFGPSSEIAWGPWLNADARVVTQSYSCRPCNLDGCGGSKVSDCLTHLTAEAVLPPDPPTMTEQRQPSPRTLWPPSKPHRFLAHDHFFLCSPFYGQQKQ